MVPLWRRTNCLYLSPPPAPQPCVLCCSSPHLASLTGLISLTADLLAGDMSPLLATAVPGDGRRVAALRGSPWTCCSPQGHCAPQAGDCPLWRFLCLQMPSRNIFLETVSLRYILSCLSISDWKGDSCSWMMKTRQICPRET